MEELIGREARGFKFDTKFNEVRFDPEMEDYVGKVGIIEEQYTYEGYLYIRIRFEDGRCWTYPGTEVKKHLIHEVDGEEIVIGQEYEFQSEVGVKVINKSGFDLPKYETKGSAGVDVRSTERFRMMPGQRQLYRTGLFLEIPMGYEAQVRPRSGLAIKSGITVLNAPGTLDSDFTGEVGVILINLSDVPFVVEKGDTIAQIVFARVDQAMWIEVEKLTETERGQGGFGSTGIK